YHSSNYLQSQPLYHYILSFPSIIPPPPRSTLFPYTTLFRSNNGDCFRPYKAFRSNSMDPDRSKPSGHSQYVSSSSLLLVNALTRSEEHTSELQSRGHLVCRLLLEKKKTDRDLGLLCSEFSVL